MALRVFNYEMPDKTIVPEAYVRVKNVLVESNDYELLEPTTDDPEGDLKVTWTTRFDGKSAIFVYADEQCRKNNVVPIHWFAIEYDCQPDQNYYSRAYDALKNRYANFEDC